MPDISKCKNEKCPIKENCYRWTAKADEYWQTYSDFKHKGKKGCDYFWNNKNNEK